MATYAERWKIERDSRLDPAATDLPADTTAAEVTSANAFRTRMRGAVLDIAYDRLEAPVPTESQLREQLAYARYAMEQPDAVTGTLLRALLARFDTLTPAQIFAATDQQVRDAILAVLPAMAVGRDVRRT